MYIFKHHHQKNLENFSRTLLRLGLKVDSQGNLFRGLRRLAQAKSSSKEYRVLAATTYRLADACQQFYAEVQALRSPHQSTKQLQEGLSLIVAQSEQLIILSKQLTQHLQQGNSNSFLQQVSSLEALLQQTKEKIDGLTAATEEVYPGTAPCIRGEALRISRRLPKAKVMLAVLLLGAAASFFSGCVRPTTKQLLESETFQELVSLEKVSHVQGLLKKELEKKYSAAVNLLRLGEYIIPKNIFNAYVAVVDDRPGVAASRAGAFLFLNYLNTPERKAKFLSALHNLGANSDEIQAYFTIFTQAGVIVFSTVCLENNSLLTDLPHERMHREMSKLSSADRSYLKNVVKQLLRKTYSLKEAKEKGIIGAQDKTYYSQEFPAVNEMPLNPIPGAITSKVHLSWEEFYTYLAGGLFTPSTTEALRLEYPQAYRIWLNIKQKVAL